MKLINLTAPFHKVQVLTERLPLKSDRTAYTGMIYYCNHGSMETSYLDLPGHIAETDDGCHAANIDLCDYYRRKTMLLRLTPPNTEYGITPEDLETARGERPWQEWVIINALGSTGSFGIPPRSVYLTLDAVEWLKKTPCRLLVSDIYESTALEGVFLQLFGGGIATVCEPANLHKLPSGVVKLNVLFPKIAITQLPCSLTAEF